MNQRDKQDHLERWNEETRQEYEQWDQQLQDNVYVWAGFVDCFGCGNYHDPYELNEVGLCKRCQRTV